MKLINLAAFVCLGGAAFAQEVQFDYNRSANFNAYKTYQWVDSQSSAGRRPAPGSGHQTRRGRATCREGSAAGGEWR